MARTIAKSIYRGAVVLLIQQTLLSTTVNADCYARSGITALQSSAYSGPELVSCGNGTNNCCLSGQKCGSNLLCVGERLSREYCADPSWKGCSTLCPQGQNAGWEIQKCGNNTYCCGKGCDCKNAPLYYVDPTNGDVSNATDVKEMSTETVSWWSVDSSASLSPTPRPTTSSTSSAPAQTTSTPSSSSSSSSTSSASSPTTTPSGAPSTSKEPQTSGFSGAAGVGIGLGSAALFALIVGLIWFLLQRRKERLEIEKRKARAADAVPRTNPFEDQAYPAAVYSHKMHEMDGVWPDREIEGRQMPAPPRPRHEMDGTQTAPEMTVKDNYLRLHDRDQDLT